MKAVSATHIDSQTKFKGRLTKVEGNNVTITLEDIDKEVSFDFDQLRKLRVSPEFS